MSLAFCEFRAGICDKCCLRVGWEVDSGVDNENRIPIVCAIKDLVTARAKVAVLHSSSLVLLLPNGSFDRGVRSSGAYYFDQRDNSHQKQEIPRSRFPPLEQDHDYLVFDVQM